MTSTCYGCSTMISASNSMLLLKSLLPESGSWGLQFHRWKNTPCVFHIYCFPWVLALVILFMRPVLTQHASLLSISRLIVSPASIPSLPLFDRDGHLEWLP